MGKPGQDSGSLSNPSTQARIFSTASQAEVRSSRGRAVGVPWPFIDELSDSDAAAVLAGMEEVRDWGLRAARHLDGEIWEVRVDGSRVIYRVLFAEEGSRGQVLLALEGFNKKTQRTPPSIIKLAKRRLADWRRRGDQKREARGRRPLHR